MSELSSSHRRKVQARIKIHNSVSLSLSSFSPFAWMVLVMGPTDRLLVGDTYLTQSSTTVFLCSSAAIAASRLRSSSSYPRKKVHTYVSHLAGLYAHVRVRVRTYNCAPYSYFEESALLFSDPFQIVASVCPCSIRNCVSFGVAIGRKFKST